MSEPLDKAKAALLVAKDLIENTELDHRGELPLKVDLDISRLISVAGVQAQIAQAEALEALLAHLIRQSASFNGPAPAELFGMEQT